jgi:hypothetical protein
MKVKTLDLIGPTLDWAVAKCEGVDVEYVNDGITKCLLHRPGGRYAPATDWAQGGSIIESQRIYVKPNSGNKEWRSYVLIDWEGIAWSHFGPTPLIAAMRCYVASQMGDVVEVPDELR